MFVNAYLDCNERQYGLVIHSTPICTMEIVGPKWTAVVMSNNRTYYVPYSLNDFRKLLFTP